MGAMLLLLLAVEMVGWLCYRWWVVRWSRLPPASVPEQGESVWMAVTTSTNPRLLVESAFYDQPLSSLSRSAVQMWLSGLGCGERL